MEYRLNNIAESFMNKIKKVRDQKENKPLDLMRQRLKDDFNYIRFAYPPLGDYLQNKFNGGTPFSKIDAANCQIVLYENFTFEEFENSVPNIEPYTFNEFKYFLAAKSKGGNNSVKSDFLTEITIPETWNSIEIYTFRNFFKLYTVHFAGDVREFKENAFNQSGIKNIDLSGVENIRSYCFGNCPELTDVIIPDSVKFLGGQCFENSNVRNITLSNYIQEIPWHCFAYCLQLVSINIPPSVRVIGEDAFMKCKSLRHVKLPNSIIQIKKSAFSDCTDLRRITLPASLKKMGTKCFSGCNKLKRITINSKLNLSGENAFGLDSFAPFNIFIPESLRTFYSSDRHLNPKFLDKIVYF